MAPYRTLPASDSETTPPPPKGGRKRTIIAVLATVALHGIVFGASILATPRAEAAPQTRTVTVLNGTVAWDGFHSDGVREARVRR